MTDSPRICDTGDRGLPCGKFLPNQPFRKGVDCFLCWWNNQRVGDTEKGPTPLPVVRETLPQCIHLGKLTSDKIGVRDGHRRKVVSVYQCRVFKQCTVDLEAPGMACCNPPSPKECRGRFPKSHTTKTLPLPPPGGNEGDSNPTKIVDPNGISWQYGVTTVLSRKDTLLPKTLESLKKGGFDFPTLFVDGCNHIEASWYEREFGLNAVTRNPVIRTFGNWVLGMVELYVRHPLADRYAMFQDDLVCVKNMKGYLEKTTLPERGYINLYSFPRNEEGKEERGYHITSQRGWGALGLVFSRDCLLDLFTQRHMIDRPQDQARGYQSIDGGIVSAMNKAGWKEYVHNPCLIQHTGRKSSMGHKPFPQSHTFLGEGYDAMDLLKS